MWTLLAFCFSSISFSEVWIVLRRLAVSWTRSRARRFCVPSVSARLKWLRRCSAFLPAAIVGLALHKKIEALLGHPEVVAVALIVGGIAILVIERVRKDDSIHGVAAIPLSRALGVGIIQCVAMIPGISRSGATIMGALLLGVERRTAAEFSFFLAIPTMIGATSLELVKNRHELAAGGGVGMATILVGTLVSFIVALVVIRSFTAYISRRGFAPFAWYRIVVGAAALIWLATV